MVMQEQARRLSEPLRWGRREKAIVLALLACVVVALGALGVYGLSSGSSGAADCVDLTFPSTLGAAEVKGCGAKARAICASGAYRGIAREMQTACEKAGFPFRQPS
jgi:hypothetical protein